MPVEQRTPEEQIRNMSFDEAYETLLLADLNEQGEKVKQQARYGIDITFDVYEWINNIIVIKPKKGYAIIHGKKHKLAKVLS